MEKLPNIFKGKAPNNNNQESSVIRNTKEDKVEIVEENIDKQIKRIFSSDSFVYKADTTITLTNGEIINKTIIGRTNDSLITLDDELIDVKNISKIELS